MKNQHPHRFSSTDQPSHEKRSNGAFRRYARERFVESILKARIDGDKDLLLDGIDNVVECYKNMDMANKAKFILDFIDKFTDKSFDVEGFAEKYQIVLPKEAVKL